MVLREDAVEMRKEMKEGAMFVHDEQYSVITTPLSEFPRDVPANSKTAKPYISSDAELVDNEDVDDDSSISKETLREHPANHDHTPAKPATEPKRNAKRLAPDDTRPFKRLHGRNVLTRTSETSAEPCKMVFADDDEIEESIPADHAPSDASIKYNWGESTGSARSYVKARQCQV